MAALRIFLDRLYLIAGYIAGVFLILIFLLMMALSVGRILRVKVTDGDYFVAWCMVAMGFLALAHTFRKGEIIRMGLVVERLTGQARRIVECIALVAGLSLCGFFAWHASKMTWESFVFKEPSTGILPIPIWIPQSGMAIGLILLVIAMIDELVHVLSGGFPRYSREPPKTKEELLQRAAAGEL